MEILEEVVLATVTLQSDSKGAEGKYKFLRRNYFLKIAGGFFVVFVLFVRSFVFN